MKVLKKFLLSIGIALAASVFAGQIVLVHAEDIVITDIAAWNHPVKKVLTDHQISLHKVVLTNDKTYPIFYVQFKKPFSLENETYYNTLAHQLAAANSYWDYKMMDENTGNAMEVKCDRQMKVVSQLLINSQANFFVDLLQKQAISRYKPIAPIKVKSESRLLKTMVNTNWILRGEAAILGKADSYFDGYAVYFSKGVKISGLMKTFNIVFDERYKENIIGSINMRTAPQDIVKALGTPHFIDDKKQVFGYKTEDFYIFFIGETKLKGISIYRRDTSYGREDLWQVVKDIKAQNDDTAYEVIDKITKLWPDYDYCYNARGSIAVYYYSKGIEMAYTLGDEEPFIKVYGNYEGKLSGSISLPDKITMLEAFSSPVMMLQLDVDDVFLYESNRLETEKNLDVRRSKDGLISPDKTMRIMENDGGVYENSGLYLLHTKKNKADVEIRPGYFVFDFQWINNRYFIYVVGMQGVYIYDIKEGKVMSVVTNEQLKYFVTDYKIKSVKSGIIIVTDGDNGKTYTRKYRFDKKGKLILGN